MRGHEVLFIDVFAQRQHAVAVAKDIRHYRRRVGDRVRILSRGVRAEGEVLPVWVVAWVRPTLEERNFHVEDGDDA